MQSIYEGDVRFEHCYRLDLDLNIAPSHREACWKQWLTSYTYGQPRDRIEYARRRVRAFASGDVTRPSLDAANAAAAAERRQFYLVVPEPMSPHASPPALATVVPSASSAPPPAAAPEPARAPASRCTAACDSSWRSCESACAPDGGASETACKSCEPDYKRCMKRCFD
ncbi:MAG: hypothetical protein QM756_22600 [Polyangiaceae bacterium]